MMAPLLLTLTSNPQGEDVMAVDLILKNGLISDGTGADAYQGDVAVSAGKIVGVGEVDEAATRMLDVDGLVVVPGFWDVHTHYDAQLLWDPIATSSCWHGATTVVMGNCGFSIAPCKPEDQSWMIKTLARVEGMNREVLERTLPWPFETFGDYLGALDGAIGVNAIAQVGHTAVRRYVMGVESSEREATEDEIARMKQVVAESLNAGGMGFTTSRVATHWDGDGLPVPSRLSTIDEYYALIEELQAINAGFIELAAGPDFSRYTEAGMARLVELTRRSGRPVCWNSISQSVTEPEAWKDHLRMLGEMRDQGVPFFALGHTQPDDFEFTFEFTNVFDRWETWQKILIEPRETKMAKMRDGVIRGVLRDEMKTDPVRGFPMNWEITMLVKSTTGLYSKFEGMRVTEIAARMGKDPLDTAFDIALDEDLTTQFRQLDTRNADPNVMMEVLNAPHVAAGFSDAGAHLITEVNTGFSTRLLGHWVREKQAMRLEDAVRRLSSVQAEESGVTDRGKVLEGYVADLTIFDPQTVGPSERTFVNDLPGGARRLVQYSEGIEYTLVNGVVTMAHGKHTGATAGCVIRSGEYAA